MTEGWSRRAVLRAAGAAAAGAWAAGCGGATVRALAPVAAGPPRGWLELRAQLRAIVESGAAEAAFARTVLSVGARADGDEQLAHIASHAGAVVIGAGREVATADLTEAGIERAARELRVGGPRRDVATARDLVSLGAEVVSADGSDALARAVVLFDRARGVGGSRIVYRGAFWDTDDERTIVVAGGRERVQRIARVRHGLTLVATSNASAFVTTAERAGTLAHDDAVLPDGAIDGAAETALELLTARAVEPAAYDLALGPDVLAAVLRDAFGPGACADAWRAGDAAAAALVGEPIAAPWLTLIDDPTAAGGWASRAFDDEGMDAAPFAVVEGGGLRGPLTDAAGAWELGAPRTGHARRPAPTARVTARATNLAVRGGDAVELDRGLVIDGALAVRSDPRTWSVVVRAARAREVAGGKPTGRRYGPVLVVATVPELLTAARGTSTDGALITRATVTPC